MLASTLASEEVRDRGAEHPAVRQQLLAVVANTLRWAGARDPGATGSSSSLPAGAAVVDEVVSTHLFSVLLQLAGYEKEAGRQAAVQVGAGGGRERGVMLT